MNERALLGDAFGHHGWATLQLIDACGMLTSDQLNTSVTGTYGSILDTMRHLVGSDASYLYVCSGGRVDRIDADAMDLRQLRDAAERHARAWLELLDSSPDPTAVLVRHRDDGSETYAPLSVRLAQALHHGTDHRSQVCTTLTSLGIEPPMIDVWDYARQASLLREVPPPA